MSQRASKVPEAADAGAAHHAAIARQAVRVLHGADPVSPCVAVCRMDDRTGLCAGCLRSLDEIAAWSRLDIAERRAVWARLQQRAEEHRLR